LGQGFQLVLVNKLVGGAHAEKQHDRVGQPGPLAVAQHGHQRYHARAAGHQQQRSGNAIDGPHKVAADGAAHLQFIAYRHAFVQVARYLAAANPFHSEGNFAGLLRGRGNGVAALGLVAVGSR